MKLKDYLGLINFFKTNFPENKLILSAWQIAQEQPFFLRDLLSELDHAVELFNEYRAGKLVLDIDTEILINANTLKSVLDGKMVLPLSEIAFGDLVSDEKLKKAFVEEFSRFEFLAEIGNTAKLLSCILVASYRTYMLVKYPSLKEKNAQIASALEEMFAIMALTGKEKLLFKATKHWIMDWKAEGFSQELANKIANIKV